MKFHRWHTVSIDCLQELREALPTVLTESVEERHRRTLTVEHAIDDVHNAAERRIVHGNDARAVSRRKLLLGDAEKVDANFLLRRADALDELLVFPMGRARKAGNDVRREELAQLASVDVDRCVGRDLVRCL